jgi:fructose-specific component phosphotransferase system IIB-like protein
MKEYKDPVKKDLKRFIWLSLMIMTLLILLIVWVVFKFKNEKRFTVVTLYGKGSAINLSKNYHFTSFSSGNKRKGAVLAEQNDLLALNNTFIHFTNVKNDSLHVNDDGDSLVFINGKLNTVIISDTVDLLPWFRTMTATDISHIETIFFASKIPAGYTPYLKKIAGLKPAIALAFEEDDSLILQQDYAGLQDFFKPRFFKASVTQDKFALIGQWKNAECLYLDLLDSVVTAPLPPMPALKECILNGDNVKTIGPSFFNNNTQLEKLTLMMKVPDYSLLQPLDHLQELTINNAAHIADMSSITNKLNQLSVLIISGDYKPVDSLIHGKKLRWLGLPANTSQQQFNSLATNLPGLQVLEISGSDSITSLEALQQIPDLRGLVITDTVTDKKSLYALKKLRYLSLPQNNQQDSAYLVAMEKALPGCIVVPNSGACLGSGWLLLLAPLILLLGIITRKKRIQKTP